jgi:APA family basic amino acid/polyamine antiporter
MNKKGLSIPVLIAIVIGNMVGTGIFVLPASLAKYGTISLFSWLFTSFGALLLAITFTFLNKRFPHTGGPYLYCKHAFGRLTGFIIAIMYWLSNMVCIAGVCLAATSYLGFAFPILNSNNPTYEPSYSLMLELAIIWLFTLINILGIQLAGLVQLFLTTIKVIPLIIIIIFGLGNIHLVNLTQFNIDNTSNYDALSHAATLTFWAFIGLEAAVIPSENTSGASAVSKATIWGTLISISIYILISFVLMGMISVVELQNSSFPIAKAGSMLFGPLGALIITIFAYISGIGALNVCLLIQGQIIFAAARDNLFPRWLAKVSRRGIPIRGQLISSTLISLLLILTMEPTFIKQFDFIALLAALFALTTYLVSALAEIKFIYQDQIPLVNKIFNKSTLIVVFATAYSFWMISSLSFSVLKFDFLTIASCIPVYYFFIKKYSH